MLLERTTEYNFSKKGKSVGTKDTAIVLQHRSHTLSLLSEQYGKYELYWYQKKNELLLSPGSLISYSFTGGHKKKVDELSLEAAPFLLAGSSIYFLHSLIELCSFFIPLGSCEHSIYKIVHHILLFFKEPLTIKMEKVIFCLLFTHLGIVPDNKDIEPYISFFLQLPIDKFYDLDLQLVQERILDEWLFWSLSVHPFRKSLKALPYIVKSER